MIFVLLDTDAACNQHQCRRAKPSDGILLYSASWSGEQRVRIFTQATEYFIKSSGSLKRVEFIINFLRFTLFFCFQRLDISSLVTYQLAKLITQSNIRRPSVHPFVSTGGTKMSSTSDLWTPWVSTTRHTKN